MKLTLRQQLTQFAHVLKGQLFSAVEEAVGELDDTARRLVAVLEMIPRPLCAGLPRLDRTAFQRSPGDRLCLCS